MPIDPRRPLQPNQATKVIRRALVEGRSVSPSSHFKKQLARRNVTMAEVDQAIRNGSVRMPGEPHLRTGNFTYRVEGTTADDRRLTIAVCPMSEAHIVLLTVFES